MNMIMAWAADKSNFMQTPFVKHSSYAAVTMTFFRYEMMAGEGR